MECNICGAKDATVHLTEVINDKVTKLHLCEQCAKMKSHEMHSHFGLSDLLSGLMDLDPSAGEGEINQNVETKCPECGMTYYDFQKSGRLGCGKCYEIFENDLNDLLKKIHGSDRHTGKMPFKSKGAIKKREELQHLKKDLNKLVEQEEFEKAALLRDRIKELMTKLNDGTDDHEN